MTEPIKLGKESQLFIDDYCIGNLNRVRKKFHQVKKHTANPLMTCEGLETDIQVYGNVMFDEEMGLYRMWYNMRYGPTNRHFAICHATSADGLSWERTQLNWFEYEGTQLPNVILTGYLRAPTVFFTPEDPDPARRYRMFVHTGADIPGYPDKKSPLSQHYSVMFSPDGLKWTPYENNPVVQGGDVATCMWDPVTKEYVSFPRIHRADIGPEADARRCVGVSASDDFLTWKTPNIVLSADAIDDARVESRLEPFRNLLVYDDPSFYSADMQGMAAFRYEGMRIGLVWFYDRASQRPMEFGHNDDGILNIQLAYTRSVDPYLGWKRAGDRYNFIPCGAEGEHDCAMIFTAHTVVEHGDELWFYYTGHSQSHGNFYNAWAGSEPNSCFSRHPILPTTINVATLRRDGFASIDALYPGGSMTTKLIIFEGDRLLINADAEKGFIQVEVTDEDNKPIPGFTKDESVAFSADEIRGEMKWTSGRSLAELQGTPVHLVFHMRTARLYSFKFC